MSGDSREELAREEISDLRRRLADERFAEELRDALTLAAAAGEVSAPVSHSRLLEMIVKTAASVIPSRAAALFLIDGEGEELIFQVALGPEAERVKNLRVPLGHGVAGLVAVSGQPMAISDAKSDPRYAFYYNPEPPVEFGAPGIDVRVAWSEGGWITATGNSFAAPHITGVVAKILGKHPYLTLFQMKTVLRALSANMARGAADRQVASPDG